MARVLLLGEPKGSGKNIIAQFASRGIYVEWHWRERTDAGRRKFPACDGVIAHISGCSHALTETVRPLATRARVPFVDFNGWARSTDQLRQAGLLTDSLTDSQEDPMRLQQVVRNEIARGPGRSNAAIATAVARTLGGGPVNPGVVAQVRRSLGLTAVLPVVEPVEEPVESVEPVKEPVKEPVEPVEEVKSKDEQMDELVMAAYGVWSSLPETLRTSVRDYLLALDDGGSPEIPENVRNYFRTFDGTPRPFIAMALMATRGSPVTQSTISRANLNVNFKKLESTLINRIAARAADLDGTAYGLRKGSPFQFSRKAATPEPVIEPVVKTEPVIEPVVETETVKTITEPEPIIEEAPVAQTQTETQNAQTNENQQPTAAASARLLAMVLPTCKVGDPFTLQQVGNKFTLKFADGTKITIE